MPTVRIQQVPRGQTEQVVPGVPYVAQHMKASEPGTGTIEAEGGETIVGDINRDGMVEHMQITGPSHAQGGVELDVDPGAFIFSDSKKLRIKDPEVLAKFTKSASKKGYTPAQIAKQYDVNTHVNTLKQPDANPFAAQTAQYMLDQNMKKLGELSMLQEQMKGLPTGVPMLAEQTQQMAMGGLVHYDGGGENKPKKPFMLPSDTTTLRVLADNRADMSYGVGISGQVQPASLPVRPPVRQDQATGYWDRVIHNQPQRDPRAQQALEKMVPFYGAESEGLLDYIGNIFTAPQNEMNHLMTGFYESPMTTAARYNELGTGTRLAGDIATDPLIVGDMAAKGAITGGKAIASKAIEYAPGIANAASAAAKVTKAFGKSVAAKLAPYLGKIPTDKLLLIGGRISQAGIHRSAGDTPLSVDELNTLGAPQHIYDFLTNKGKSTPNIPETNDGYNWSNQFGNIPDPSTNLPEVAITGNREQQLADDQTALAEEQALREASDALYSHLTDPPKASTKAPKQVVTTRPRQAPARPAPVATQRTYAASAPVAAKPTSNSNAAQAAFDLDD